MPESRVVIVAAVEPSTASDQVIHTAAAMARLVPGAELHFIHVIDLGGPPYNTSVPLSVLMTDAREYPDGVIATAAKLTDARASAHVGVGAPAKRIVQIAADLAADLLVIGTHDRRGLSHVFGSISRRVLRGASCPVLLARTKHEEKESGPQIEPPCPDCLAVQQRTHGETLWCEAHAARHVHGHLHYTEPKPTFGDGSMLIRPQP